MSSARNLLSYGPGRPAEYQSSYDFYLFLGNNLLITPSKRNKSSKVCNLSDLKNLSMFVLIPFVAMYCFTRDKPNALSVSTPPLATAADFASSASAVSPLSASGFVSLSSSCEQEYQKKNHANKHAAAGVVGLAVLICELHNF